MFSERKFRGLNSITQHKKAAKALRVIWEGGAPDLYLKCQTCLGLTPVKLDDSKEIADRYHWHLGKAQLSLKEHRFLPLVRQGDTPSEAPYLPIAIYLDQLRSAYNVGNILRTVEALRVGKVYFSKATPFIDNIKVQKTSMFTYDRVECHQVDSLATLPRPLIALETIEDAPSIYNFDFPGTFTLMLGNEEYGLSNASLEAADAFVHIPLFGCKNSINVAAAFAIAAAKIRESVAVKGEMGL